jgi:adenosylhomocysteine nucleosidase
MSRLLILTAVDLEARALARHLGLVPLAGRPWPRFTGGALDIVPVGVAACQLAARLADVAVPSLIVSAGVCGALAPQLGVGALVVPEAVLAPDGRRHTTAAVGLRRSGILVSTDRVLEDAAAKSRLWLDTGALAVDLESAEILAWAAERGVAGVVVRGVCDPAGRGVPADLARAVQDDGRMRPMRAVTAMLARPGALADVVALRNGTAAALKTVATTLGTLARMV